MKKRARAKNSWGEYLYLYMDIVARLNVVHAFAYVEIDSKAEHASSCTCGVAADCVFVAVCVASHCSARCSALFIRSRASVLSPQTVYLLQCVLQCVLHGVAVCVATCVSSEFVHLQCLRRLYMCCLVCCSVCYTALQCMLQRALHWSSCICSVAVESTYVTVCVAVYVAACVHFVFLESSCICGSAAAFVFVESTKFSSTQIRVFMNYHSYMYLS